MYHKYNTKVNILLPPTILYITIIRKLYSRRLYTNYIYNVNKMLPQYTATLKLHIKPKNICKL